MIKIKIVERTSRALDMKVKSRKSVSLIWILPAGFASNLISNAPPSQFFPDSKSGHFWTGILVKMHRDLGTQTIWSQFFSRIELENLSATEVPFKSLQDAAYF